MVANLRRMSRKQWRDPNPAPAGPVTPVELFFDLVFVFTLTQLTRTLGRDFSIVGAGRVVLVFGVLWYMYAGYAWLTNHVPPRRTSQKLLLFAGMAGFLVTAIAIPHAFDTAGVFLGVGYLLVVVVHLVLFTQANVLAGVLRLAPFNLTAALLVLAGGLVQGTATYVLWIAAFVFLAATPYITPRSRVSVASSFHLSPAHFVERHSLLVIIALGESVIAIGAGVDVDHVTAGVVGVTILALTLPAMLWWTYFHDAVGAEHSLERADPAARGLLAVRAYFYAHIAVLLGIVFAAAGIHGAIAHPGEPPGWPAGTALAGGIALFLVGVAEFKRVLGTGVLVSRLVAALVVLATIPLSAAVSAGVQLALVVAVTGLMLVIDARSERGAVAADRLELRAAD